MSRRANAPLVELQPRQSLTKRIAVGLIFASLAVNVVVPKAGVKVGDVPVTAGTIVCVLALIVGLFAFLAGRRINFTPVTTLIMVLSGYMGVRSLIDWMLGEVRIEYVWGLVVGPMLFVLVSNALTTSREIEIAVKILVVGFVLVTAYAVLQYILGVNAVAIPGITVNLTDYQTGAEWYLQKHNRVGSGSKLFSTYQNGNLLGVNLLLIFPVVYEVVRRQWKLPALVAFVAVAMLTLSRSAWLGVAAYLAFRFVFTKSATAAAAAARIFAGIALIIAGAALFGAFPQVTDRLFGSNVDYLTRLSGRTPRLTQLIESTITNPIAVFFGPQGISEYEGGAYEITYAAVYLAGGLIALALLVAILVRSIHSLLKSVDRVAIGVGFGIMVYAVASFIEGGFWLPPTPSLFWMILGLGFAAAAQPGATLSARRG